MTFIATVSVLLLFLQCSSGNIPHINTESTEVPVEINIRPDTYRHQQKRSPGQIPDKISASLNVDGATINLHLRKNPDITDDVPVFLQRKGSVHRYTFPAREVMAAYQDITYGASFLIWDKTQDGTKDNIQERQHYHMFGTLLVHNSTFLVQPPHLSGVNYHTIARVKSDTPTQTDYIDLPDYGVFEKTSDIKEIFNGTRKKRQTISYEVEVLIVVDNAVYNFWYTQTPGSGPSRHTATVNSIKQFYSFVMNSMNLRYQTVTGRGFTIVCLYAGIYIADTPSGAPFVENNIYATGSGSTRTQILAADVLPDFRSWANTNLITIASYDHAMMFSAYDFITVSGSQVSTGTAGLAYLGALCSDARYSINEDHFTAGLVTVASHELGHNLGARHDGDGNGCSSDDGFIMSASAFTSLDNPGYNAGQWIFSLCSLAYFESFVNFLNNGNQNCMLSRSSSYNAAALAEYSEDVAGQVYSPDYQCEQGVGPGSYLYRSYYEDDYTTVCQVLACSVPSNDGSFTSKLTWEGTSCGNGLMCRASNCVSSPKAPSGISDSCVFGDIPYNLPGQGQTCSEFLGDPSTSYHCYQTFYRRSCCATCNIHKQNSAGIADCEYGDKAAFCSSISTRDCYSNDQACCKTCADRASRNPDCKYGDRVSGCLSLLCPVYNLLTRRSCCGTCGDATTTSTTTTSAPTTTATSATTTLTSSSALTGSGILRPILTTLFGPFRPHPVTTPTIAAQTPTIIPTTIPLNITSSVATLTATASTASNTQPSSNTQTILPTTVPRNITSTIASLTATQTTNSNTQTIIPTTIPRNITSSVATLTATQTTNSNTQTIVPTTVPRNITATVATLTATQTTNSNTQTIIPTTIPRNITSSVATLTATQSTNTVTQTIVPTTISRNITSSVATLTATQTTNSNTQTIVPTTVPRNITATVATLTATQTTNSNTQTILPTTIPRNITSSVATLTATQSTNAVTQTIVPTTISRNITSSVATLTATQTTNSNTQTIVPTTVPRNITATVATLTATQTTNSNTQTILPTTIPRNITSSVASLTATQSTNAVTRTIVPTTISRNITSSVATLTATQTTNSNTQTIVPTTVPRNITATVATLTATQTTNSNTQTILPTTIPRNITSSVASLTATQSTNAVTRTIVPTTISRNITSSVATLTATQTTNSNTQTIVPTTVPRNITATVATLTATQTTNSNTQTILPTTIPRNITSSVATLTATQSTNAVTQTIVPTTISRNITSFVATLTATQTTNSNTQTIVPTTVPRNITATVATLTATQTTNSNTQTIIPTTIPRNITSSNATLTATQSTNTKAATTIIPTTIQRNVTSSVTTLTVIRTSQSNKPTTSASAPTSAQTQTTNFTVFQSPETSPALTSTSDPTTSTSTTSSVPTTSSPSSSTLAQRTSSTSSVSTTISATRRVRILLIFPMVITNVNFDDTASDSYTELLQTVLTQLRDVYISILGNRLRAVVIIKLRPGTLIVEFEVEFDNDPAVTSDLTDINVKLVNGEIAITVYNQTASATFIEIGDAAATKSTVHQNICALFNAAGGCFSGHSCSIVNKKATCGSSTLSGSRSVKIILIFPVRITDVDFDNTSSQGYQNMLHSILIQLRVIYLGMLGDRFKGISFMRLRPGTLIVEYVVEIEDDPSVTSDLTDVNVKLVTGEKNITISNEISSAILIQIGNITASKSTVLDNICDLFTASGGCYAGYQCSLKDGKATCDNDDIVPGIRTVRIMLVLPVTISDVNFDDTESAGYINLLQTILNQLRIIYMDMLGQWFRAITVISLRPGTLIIEYDVEYNDDPSVRADLADILIKLLTGERTITVANQEASASLIEMNNVTVTRSTVQEYICDIFNAAGGCTAGGRCIVRNGKPTCEVGETTDSRNVEIRLVYPVIGNDVNFDDTSSASYQNLLQSVLIQLQIAYMDILGNRFKGITTITLRPGTLIVDYEVAIDDDPTVTADLTDVNVKLVTGDKTITFSNQLASANIIQIGNVTATKSTIMDNICSLFTASGGCLSGFRCVVRDRKASCEEEENTSVTRTVRIILVLPVIITDVNLDDPNSDGYKTLLQTILTQLRVIYTEVLGNGLKSITIVSLRPGTLIVEYDVEFEDDPTVTADLTDVNLKLVTGEKQLIISNQAVSPNSVEVANATATKATASNNVCAMFDASGGCKPGYHCVEVDGRAACKADAETRTRLALVLALAVGLPLLFILLTILVCLVLRARRMGKLEKKMPSSVSSSYSDRMDHDGVKQVFPSVVPYGGISTWDSPYMTGYPNYYNIVPFGGKITNPGIDGLQAYAYDNRADNLDSMVAYTYVKPPNAYA